MKQGMISPFKHYVWIPYEVENRAKYRMEADDEYLAARGLTINDVTFEDQGEIEPHVYLSVFTPKPFLWLRRLFRWL